MSINSPARCMNWHVETHGSGAPLVLIHGWGMHGGVWDSLVPQLAERFCVQVVDLPGHGRSLPLPSVRQAADQLDAIVAALAQRFDSQPLTVCGWSLGGQIALRWAARHPAQVAELVLVASTPCFAARPDWSCGMAAEVLQQFAAELELNYAATLRRFLALQVRGSENERELLIRLRAQLFVHGEPDLATLRSGLEILREADLRPDLAAIVQPVRVIAGGRDKLTPPEASRYLAASLSNARLTEIAAAAHAPFLSHSELFLAALFNN